MSEFRDVNCPSDIAIPTLYRSLSIWWRRKEEIFFFPDLIPGNTSGERI